MARYYAEWHQPVGHSMQFFPVWHHNKYRKKKLRKKKLFGGKLKKRRLATKSRNLYFFFTGRETGASRQHRGPIEAPPLIKLHRNMLPRGSRGPLNSGRHYCREASPLRRRRWQKSHRAAKCRGRSFVQSAGIFFFLGGGKLRGP